MERHRRTGACTLIAAMAMMLAFTAAMAQPAKPWRIAIVFAADADQDATSARDLARQIGADLTRSGHATIVDPAAYVGIVPAFDAVPRFPEWSRIGADVLVVGRLASAPNGRLNVKFRLWNVFTQAQMLGREYGFNLGHLPDVEAFIVESIDDRLGPSPARLVLFPR